jgi:hypothetical protein
MSLWIFFKTRRTLILVFSKKKKRFLLLMTFFLIRLIAGCTRQIDDEFISVERNLRLQSNQYKIGVLICSLQLSNMRSLMISKFIFDFDFYTEYLIYSFYSYLLMINWHPRKLLWPVNVLFRRFIQTYDLFMTLWSKTTRRKKKTREKEKGKESEIIAY